jgi:hypothetical protein
MLEWEYSDLQFVVWIYTPLLITVAPASLLPDIPGAMWCERVLTAVVGVVNFGQVEEICQPIT